ncbi:MAG: hypothetical protein M1812_003290 [Candelaria pacifica]|nr:MAG: hypothetical protein M1812_003290 [Candelaria pacifica]
MDEDSFCELMDECMEHACNCLCHDDERGDYSEWFYSDAENNEKLGADHLAGDKTDETRNGVFPFLKLPTELRDKVYKYALKRSGDLRKRTTPFLRGEMDTAILYTCRQINREARHIPLTINQLSFANSFTAFRFVASAVAPTQKQLVRSLQIDIQGVAELHTESYQCFISELTKMSIKHLSVTLRGAISKEWLVNSTCLKTNLGVLKGLESFDLIVGCGWIPKDVKDSVSEALRDTLLRRSLPLTSAKKGKAPKKSKVNVGEISDISDAISMTATKAKTLRSGKTVAPKQTVAPKVLGLLLQQSKRLADYAESIDGGLSVKLRLSSAVEAAKEGKPTEFDALAKGIVATLEEQFDIIRDRRSKVLH